MQIFPEDDSFNEFKIKPVQTFEFTINPKIKESDFSMEISFTVKSYGDVTIAIT